MPSPAGCVCPGTKPLLWSVQRCCMTFSAMTGAEMYSAAICTGIPAYSASCACMRLYMGTLQQSAPNVCSVFRMKSAKPSRGTCSLLQPYRARASHGLSHWPTKSSLPEKWLPLSAAICPPLAAERCPKHKKITAVWMRLSETAVFVLVTNPECSFYRAAFCAFARGDRQNKPPAAPV